MVSSDSPRDFSELRFERIGLPLLGPIALARPGRFVKVDLMENIRQRKAYANRYGLSEAAGWRQIWEAHVAQDTEEFEYFKPRLMVVESREDLRKMFVK